MNTIRYDLSPLFRSTVGFDTLSKLLESTMSADAAPSYPPYNIAKVGEDEYEITMAVAGFGQSDLTVTAKDGQLIVAGNNIEKEAREGVTFLHKGIAQRSFERKFSLADHVKVRGANLKDGLLTLSLLREVPEESKPRQIAINVGETVNGKAAKKLAETK